MSSDPHGHLRARFYLLLTVAASLAAGCSLGNSLPSRAGDTSSAGGGSAGGDPNSASGGGGTPSGGAGGGGGSGGGNNTANPSQTFSPGDFTKAYAYRGRFDFTDPGGPRYAWPNSAIGATFTGTSLAIKLAEPVPTLYNMAPVNNTYDVFVDQRPRQLVNTTPGSSTYPVVSGLPAGTHTVWISKRTEANIGRGQFGGVVLSADGNLLAPPPLRAHHLEFVGDSSSSGYGNDGNFPVWNGCKFSVATADSTVAYPQVTAELLGAEFQNLSFAGKGITRNLASVDTLTMPIIYGLWDPRDTSATYTFPGPAAEVTVVNIGGNDWTGDGPVGTPPDQTAFVDGYLKLLQGVRAHSPKTTLVLAVTAQAHGQDRTTYIAYLQAVVSAAGDQGMADVHYFEFPEYQGALGYGCDGHPSPGASAQMAQLLSAAIRQIKGW